MKTLIITPAWPPLAASEASQAWHIASHLAHAGHDVHVAAPRDSDALTPEKVHLHRVIRKWSWSAAIALVNLIKRHDFKSVLVLFERSLYRNHPMIAFLPAILKKTGIKIRFVTIWQNQYGLNQNKQTWRAKTESRILAKFLGITDWPVFQALRFGSDHHVMYCHYHRDLLTLDQEGLRLKSTVLALPPLFSEIPVLGPEEKKTIRLQLKISENEKIAAFFGRIYSGKGIETLFEAFQSLTKQTSLKMLMIGGGALTENDYVEKMKALSRRLEIDKDILWSGEYGMADDLAVKWIQIADFVVLPFDAGATLSRSSLSLPLFCGLPIISTLGEGTEPELKEALYLCLPRNAQSLAAAILGVANSYTLRENLSRSAEKIGKRYHWDSFTSNLELLLRGGPPPALSGRRPGGKDRRNNLVFLARGGAA
ncbi:MAG: glycosyltransferase family 4 protein [Candidatus Omnitrophica bacterium]|nr:glycosyltransferase family 4 protein [Candidatus Omnitrophota bacterium]